MHGYIFLVRTPRIHKQLLLVLVGAFLFFRLTLVFLCFPHKLNYALVL
jgi:hypothetical protein